MNNKMQRRKSVYATAIIAFLIFSIFLAAVPMVEAAGAISLSPTVQAPGSVVTVSGLGFGANQSVGIGFGKEVKVINETSLDFASGPFDVAGGPFILYVSHVPVKPGTYRKAINISSTQFIVADTDNGNGTFSPSTVLASYFVNGTLNYVTGEVTLFAVAPFSSATHYVNFINYTTYEYNMTPAAGVKTSPSGAFSALITVPNVPAGVYTVTAVDAQGHITTAPLTVASGAMKLSSSVRAKGASITVTGTGFGLNQPVAIGFGAEVRVINETMPKFSGPYDVAGGPYYTHTSHAPIKPGSFSKYINLTLTAWWRADYDQGNGMYTSTSTTMLNGTINYVSGLITHFQTVPFASSTYYVNLANYTYYEYDVTPAAGVTTSASGAFSASITVPNVSDGVYAVTAVDSQGHMATAALTVANSGSGWDQTYGGAGGEQSLGETLQTGDGGYVILGNTSSFGAGGSDWYLVKTNANGDKIWSKTYGGALDDAPGGMCSTSDGGFMLCGGTHSAGVGGEDAWLIKTNANGDIKWYSAYGGTGNDTALFVVQTSDGGYAFAGVTSSFGAGLQDAWLVKVDANGNMQWQKTYGGAGSDWAYHLVLISGGYVLAGHTNSSGAGDNDFWLIKTDTNGNMQWNQTYGGTGIDEAFSVVATSDGGYALGGYTTSFGMWRAYLVKTDASGNMQWNKTYGGTVVVDIGIYMIKTMDGGYAIAGWSYTGATYANQNFLLIKTDAAGNLEWKNTYGGPGLENCYSLLQASDGGYVLTGETDSFGAGGKDIYLVKTNAVGVVPEGLTTGVMLTLSTLAVILSIRYFRKRPKQERW